MFSITGLIVAHTYAFVFVGLLVAGEVVLIPAVYAATLGYINLPVLFGVAIAATVAADVVWYVVGKYLPKERLWRLAFVKRREQLIQTLSAHFTNHRFKILLLSKAVYGTRTAVQVLSGMHRVPFWKYLGVNILGVASWVAFIVVVASVIQTGLGSLREVVHSTEIAFLVFVVVIVIVHVLVHRVIKRRLLE